MESNQFDLSLGLDGTHVVVTGGAGLIGSVVVKAFIAAGSSVSSLDIRYQRVTRVSEQLLEIEADISSTESMEKAWADAEHDFGPVICCVALASLDLSVLKHHDSAADMSLEQFKRTMDINVGGTFLAAKLWLQGLREQRATWGRAIEDRKKNVGLIMVGSESGWFGERSNADYAASKSAVQVGLLQSLKSDVPRVWPGARYGSPCIHQSHLIRMKNRDHMLV